MTSEELHLEVDLALNGNYGQSRRIELHRKIDEFVNDVESRTCENCKYVQPNHANDMFWCISKSNPNKYRRMDMRVDLDFGCNEFKRKDEG